jgi:hypothetical protein
MSLQELFQAMNMFKDGVQQLGTARAIDDAQSKVQELKTQQLDSMQERAQLSNISQGLTMSLAKIGAPASQISTVAGAIAPAAIGSPEDAYVQGSMAGKDGKGKSMMDFAQGFQDFKAQPDLKKLHIQGNYDIEKSRVQGEAAAQRANLKIDKETDTKFIEFGKALDPAGPRAGEFGKLQNQLNQIGRVDALFQDGFNMAGPQAEEVALGLHRLLSGSNAAHVEQVKALLPKSAMTSAQTLKSYFTNKPELLNNQEFMKSLKKTLDREKSTIQKQYKEVGYRRVTNYFELGSKDPERFHRLLRSQGLDLNEYEKFQANGGTLPDLTPLDQAKAWLQANPTDPNAPAVMKRIQELEGK